MNADMSEISYRGVSLLLEDGRTIKVHPNAAHHTLMSSDLLRPNQVFVPRRVFYMLFKSIEIKKNNRNANRILINYNNKKSKHENVKRSKV